MISIHEICERSPWPASVLVGARPSTMRLGGVYLPLFKKEFSLVDILLLPDLLYGGLWRYDRPMIDSLTDYDYELGGSRWEHVPSTIESVAAFSRGDYRAAVRILSKALPGEAGQQHPLVRRFAKAMAARLWHRHTMGHRLAGGCPVVQGEEQ